MPEQDPRLDSAMQALLGELALAQSPITGKLTACVLETADSLKGGHNLKTAPDRMIHAEGMAVITSGRQRDIHRIYMTGRGQSKLKHIAPCGNCYDLLSPRVADDTELVLVQPDTQDSYTVISAAQHRAAYAPNKYGAYISGLATTRAGIKLELQEKTPLDETDRDFIAWLRKLGNSHLIHFYLTGSASGRNGIGSLLTDGYDDFKIAAYSRHAYEYVLDVFYNLAEVHYGPLVHTRHSVMGWEDLRERDVDRFSNPRKTIDLTLAKDIAAAMPRQDYYRNNWFMRLS